MKALRLTEGKLSLREMPIPDDPSEALVRVVASGICNTDLEIVRGYAGFSGTIGHEFVGVVENTAGRPELRASVSSARSTPDAASAVVPRRRPRHCSRRTVLASSDVTAVHAEFLCCRSGTDEVPDGSATTRPFCGNRLRAATE